MGMVPRSGVIARFCRPRMLSPREERAADHLVHERLIPKPHLRLRRMNVHVHLAIRHVEEEEEGGADAGGDGGLIAAIDRPDEMSAYAPRVTSVKLVYGKAGTSRRPSFDRPLCMARQK